jgi:hypothetical protein
MTNWATTCPAACRRSGRLRQANVGLTTPVPIETSRAECERVVGEVESIVAARPAKRQ